MAKKKPMDADFIAFNVVYEDGSLSSNRKVPTSKLEGAEIGEKSGRPRSRVKTLNRVGARK